MILQVIFAFLWLTFAYFIFLIVKPLTVLILLKIKHGKDIEISFMPIVGEMYYYHRAQQKYKDSEYYIRKTIRNNPGVKMIATNFALDNIMVTIVDPQMIKQFLQAPEKYKKKELFLFGNQVSGKGIVFTEDQQWKDQRKIIGLQFTFENLKCRIPIIKQITQQVFSQSIKTDQEIKLQSVISRITGEVVTQTFFGQEFCGQIVNGKNLTQAVVECVTKQFELSLERLWTHVRGIFYGCNSKIPQFLLNKEEKKFLSELNNLKAFVQTVITKREEDFEENEKKQNQDFIQIYLSESKKQNKPISEDELFHQFITFTFAGTDTTSCLCTMICYILSQNQELQNDIRNHVKEHVKSFDDLTHQDIPKLDKLNALILEVLRVYPPAQGLIYRLSNPIYFYQVLSPQNRAIQLIVVYFPYSRVLVITIFLRNSISTAGLIMSSKNRKQKYYQRHAFIAFSAGPRNCIGQHMALTEAKIIMTYLLLNHKLVPDPQRTLEMTLIPLYNPQDDRLVHFQPLGEVDGK